MYDLTMHAQSPEGNEGVANMSLEYDVVWIDHMSKELYDGLSGTNFDLNLKFRKSHREQIGAFLKQILIQQDFFVPV